jgi:hypothetical protein
VLGGRTHALDDDPWQREPGRVFELRAAVWDVGDSALDSLVLIDDFK